MDRDKPRWKTALNAGVRRATAVGLSLVYRPRPLPRLDPARVERLLVLRNDRLGDMIVSLGALAALKELCPHAELHVAASQRNAFFIKDNPLADRVFVLQTKGSKARRPGLANLAELGRMRRVGYDAVMDFVHDNRKDSNPLLANLIARGGMASGYEKGLVPRRAFDRLVEPSRARTSHPVAELRRIVENTLAVPTGFVFPDPFIPEQAEEADFIREFRAANGVKAYAMFNFSVCQAHRAYPPDMFAALARGLLQARPEMHVIATAPPWETRSMEAFTHMAGSGRVLALPTSVHQLTELARQAEAVVSPDTSVVHVAGAVGTPVLGLYDDRRYKELVWYPRGVDYELVFCEDSGRVADIEPSRALEALERLLARTRGAS